MGLCPYSQVWQGEEVGMGPKIPQALEKILQLKEIRQEQLSTAPIGKEVKLQGATCPSLPTAGFSEGWF